MTTRIQLSPDGKTYSSLSTSTGGSHRASAQNDFDIVLTQAS
jgi:hypothetical protein